MLESYNSSIRVARQLKALMMVSGEKSAWWAAALSANPAHTAAGNPQW